MTTDNIKIDCAENCNNSPKKLLLKDFTIALAKKEFDFCLEHLRDDVTWEVIGRETFQGQDDVEQFLQNNKQTVRELQIHNIITHGNTASVNGTIIQNDGQTIAFCDIYKFGGFGKKAKITTVTSYIIELA